MDSKLDLVFINEALCFPPSHLWVGKVGLSDLFPGSLQPGLVGVAREELWRGQNAARAWSSFAKT